MISQYTWPNFHGGTDREGTKILVEEQGFTNDVKYGNTKLFIRSPQTLFALEQVRLLVGTFRNIGHYLGGPDSICISIFYLLWKFKLCKW